jgi:hypothetical protein
MNRREHQAWVIAASLFVTLFLIWGGGVNTGPVFLPPLLKYFGWTRARVSTLGSAAAAGGQGEALPSRLTVLPDQTISSVVGIRTVIGCG